MFPLQKAPAALLAALCLVPMARDAAAAGKKAAVAPATAAAQTAAPAGAITPAASEAPGEDTCDHPAKVAPAAAVPTPAPASASASAPRPAARAKAHLDAGDPFMAAVMGVLPLASGFYVSDTPVKGIAFTLADIMLIGTIIQIRSNDSIPRKDISLYYYLLGGVNMLDAALSVLQVRSDAAKRVSLQLIPSDQPQVILGFRF